MGQIKNIKLHIVTDIKNFKMSSERDEIADLFDQADTSNDGIISLKELGKMFKSLGIKLSVKDARGIIHKYDKDGSNGIDLEEFRSLITDVLSADNTYQQAYEAFKQFDRDGSNTITVAEVREACQYLDNKLGEEEVETMVKRMDQDGNGIIDFDEFAKAWAC